jgi:hypothetical protein
LTIYITAAQAARATENVMIAYLPIVLEQDMLQWLRQLPATTSTTGPTSTTKQDTLQTCFADHWGKRVEAYVDDVVIKTTNPEKFIDDLQQVFSCLRRYLWKLNLDKYVFGALTGKLLGLSLATGESKPTHKKSKPS